MNTKAEEETTMAKLYYTKDVKAFIDKEIETSMMALFNDKGIPVEDAIRYIKELRIFRKYGYEMIEMMEEDDRKDDEEMAAWRANQEAKKNGTDS